MFVAAPNLNEALHGDRVVVRIERQRPDGRVEGKIVQILERRAQTVVGRFDVDAAGLSFVVAVRSASVDGRQRGARRLAGCRARRHGHRRGHELAHADARPVGRVVEVLGDIDEPGVDTEIILRKHAIPDEHADAAVQEAVRLGTEVRERDIKGRTDFRDRPVVTIDGEDARDFDDAISIERLPNGHFWLGVHIADVAHYVVEGSAAGR